MIKSIVLLCMCIVSWFSLAGLYDIFLYEQQQRYVEGVCIANLIALEVERKDIIVEDGTCRRKYANTYH